MKTLLLILFLVPAMALAQDVAPEGVSYSQLNDSLILKTTTYYRTRTVIDTIPGYHIVYLRDELVRVPELTRTDTIRYRGDFRAFVDAVTLLPYFTETSDSARAVIKQFLTTQVQFPIKEILYAY